VESKNVLEMILGYMFSRFTYMVTVLDVEFCNNRRWSVF